MVARRQPAEGLPADFDLGAAASALGVTLSRAQRTTLLRFLELLRHWNGIYNLTALRDPAQMLTHHLLDCLSVVVPLRRQLGRSMGKRLVDVGSGGGLPGTILAVTEPGLSVCCVDAVGKKAAFVRQAAAELALPNLSSLHARAEDVHGVAFDVVASRAFASLPDFIRATRHLLAPGGVWMAMKGRTIPDEITSLPKDVVAFHVEQLEVPGLGAERCIVWMKPLSSPHVELPGG
jgi:16S rRNA (guanine527-N7)-methyltransferase